MIIDGEFGRFQGAQFDLGAELEYGEEVVLSVKCRVTEVTVRSTPSGQTRRITVLRPVDVYVEEARSESAKGDTMMELGDGVDMKIDLVDLDDDREQIDREQIDPDHKPIMVNIEKKERPPLTRKDRVVERTIERIEPKQRSVDPVLARFLHGDL